MIDQKKTGIVNLQQIFLLYENSNIKGMTLSIEEKEYMCGSLIAAENGNAPLTCINYFASWANLYASMELYTGKYLMCSYMSIILATITEDARNIVIKSNFQ